MRGWPELLALLHGLTSGLAPAESLALLLPTGLALRLAWLAAALLHGLGHLLILALLDPRPLAVDWSWIREGRSLAALTGSLLPLAPIGPAAGPPDQPAWLPAGDPTPWKVRCKAAGGVLLNLLVALAAWRAQEAAPALALLAGANLAMALLSRSDLDAVLTGQGRRLQCGNFGVITVPEAPLQGDLLPGAVLRLYERMGKETELRGSQAGGGLMLTRDRDGSPRFIGHKIVNAKRGDLTASLEAGFRRRRRLARMAGSRCDPATLLACWHYRFGTSGPPAVQETHWLQWLPARRRPIYTPGPQGWTRNQQLVQNRITHNGDFEAFAIGNSEVDVLSELGGWLENALQQPAPGVVDSARIAALMDLMICQGDWQAAARWGYLATLAPFPEVPPAACFEAWGKLFENAFLRASQGPAELAATLLPALRADPVAGRHDRDSLEIWIGVSVRAFLENDTAAAVQQFMQRARGSFGLAVVSTLQSDRVVLSSLGQPISIGVDSHRRLGVYASESAAVGAALAEGGGGWRLDLDQNAGEIAILRSSGLTLHSLSLGRELGVEELASRRSSSAPPRPSAVTLRLPPPQRQLRRDPVAADIAEIPALLWRLHNDWQNPGSANRQSAEALAQLLLAKAVNVSEKERLLERAGLAPSLARSADVDLLITGVENSLWLGEQFGADLAALMPQLSVRTESANTVLALLQNSIESLGLARQSIVLVISHSAQTFASRQVMEACDLLVRTGVIRDFFLLVGEAESLVGSPLLANRRPGESFSRRLFCSGAGRRSAEPATITAVAIQQTLTELLFQLAQQLQRGCPGAASPPLGIRLGAEALNRLAEQETQDLLRDSSEILGVDRQGRRQASATARQLRRAGRRWGQHVQETAVVWAIHAAYIMLSIELGLPLVQTLGAQALQLSGLTLAPDSLALGAEIARLGDIGVYIFGPWIWSLGLRGVQGRPLLARTGRRTLVIGETAPLHKLLSNYVSKLFSLSFGIASVDIQADTAADELLHTQAHRIVRGTLIFLGIPHGHNGRLLQAQAKAVMLASRQSDGIRHWGTGPEIVAVGADAAIHRGPFQAAIVLPDSEIPDRAHAPLSAEEELLERLRESRFGSLRRLLASYLFFWWMARSVASLPFLRFPLWRSQSRTKIMTTASPISAAQLDLAEPREVEALGLDAVANRDQS